MHELEASIERVQRLLEGLKRDLPESAHTVVYSGRKGELTPRVPEGDVKPSPLRWTPYRAPARAGAGDR